MNTSVTASNCSWLDAAFKGCARSKLYPGPCILSMHQPRPESRHGHVSAEEKRAVECGYWCNWRYNPTLLEEGKNPFHLDSREPKGNFREYLMGEVRYSSWQNSSLKKQKHSSKRPKEMPSSAENYVRIQKSYDLEIEAKKAAEQK